MVPSARERFSVFQSCPIPGLGMASVDAVKEKERKSKKRLQKRKSLRETCIEMPSFND